MKKQKNTELNFLYTNEELEIKDEKKNKKRASKKLDNKKSSKKTKRAGKKSAQKKSDSFNLDNEIVIGVTKVADEEENNKKSKIKSNRKNTKKKSKKEENKSKKKLKNEEIKQGRKKKHGKIKSILKWTILLCALASAGIFFIMSPVFNVTQIDVIGNEKIDKDTIISLSKIQMEENIYKNSSSRIKQNIKQEPYIEDVIIKRKLPNKIQINVKERMATYMLEYANSYAYINNQGYILEISETKLDIPIIMGYKTEEENIKPGNRLCNEDLEKLSITLKISESAHANKLEKDITRINIENNNNYTIIMENKKKTIYLGDASKISDKMRILTKIIQDEEGNEGEVFLNMDLNKQNAFFRKKE